MPNKLLIAALLLSGVVITIGNYVIKNTYAQSGIYPDIQFEAKVTNEAELLYQDGRSPLRGELNGYLGDFSLDPDDKRISTINHNYIVQEFTNEEAFLAATEPGDVVLVTFTNPTN